MSPAPVAWASPFPQEGVEDDTFVSRPRGFVDCVPRVEGFARSEALRGGDHGGWRGITYTPADVRLLQTIRHDLGLTRRKENRPDRDPAGTVRAAAYHDHQEPSPIPLLHQRLDGTRRHGRPPVGLTAQPCGESGVEIRVSDAGDGVHDEYRDLLFTQFASGPRSDSIGLGQWLVDVLATAHGGGAHYETVDGHPTFAVILPGQPHP